MEARLSETLGLPSPNPNHCLPTSDFVSLFTRFTDLTSTRKPVHRNPETETKSVNWFKLSKKSPKSVESAGNSGKPIFFGAPFASTSVSDPVTTRPGPDFLKWVKPASRDSPRIQTVMKNLSVFERALIGAGGGGIAGAFTYVCLHPLDTIKTKLQTKGASQLYSSTFDAIVKTFQSKGILGFYSGVSAVIVGSTFSSAVYFGTCEFGKSFLSKFPTYPSVLIPPTAGAMGNIVSSAIMVPKELITQRMQAGAKGRSYEVLLKILEKDGILGLYAGYSATLLRNLPAGVLSYSSFEYLKAAVLNKRKQTHLEPIQSVCCGALAGAISASITTPLDVVKTRLMTQVHSDAANKVAAAMYSGVTATVKQILKEEGWVGFTRGMGPRVVHSACFSALGYFAFETARLTILNEYVRRKEASEAAMLADS
ncbi:PREDICTED: protein MITOFERRINLIKE 1, chloroplastic [Tarenaya hassleriana]|uniref:protein MITOFERRINLIKE 1, chloroplastic n=1 Tax=Tarenaya hassleriana TaxID=28532 RepID=UPI00053C0F56|nr:PREDICTED: protein MITOFERRINLIKE 1, chloroplastic [Tarenaya hassleriana]